MSDFTRELSTVLNRHSKENGSDTPDFLLAQLLSKVLDAYDETIEQRRKWLGHDRFDPCKEDPVTVENVEEGLVVRIVPASGWTLNREVHPDGSILARRTKR